MFVRRDLFISANENGDSFDKYGVSKYMNSIKRTLQLYCAGQHARLCNMLTPEMQAITLSINVSEGVQLHTTQFIIT